MSSFLLIWILFSNYCEASLPTIDLKYPRCGALAKPTISSSCTIQNEVYTIKRMMDSQTSYDEYLAVIQLNSTRIIPVILQWFCIEDNETALWDFLWINEMQAGLKHHYNLTNLEQLNLIEVYGGSFPDSKQKDKSAIFVRKWHPYGDVKEFARKRLQTAKHLRKYYQEIFACHSWCDFLRQIAVPLNTLNFARVELQDIFVDTDNYQNETESYKYLLGRLERQHTEQNDTHLIISALTMAAWRYYSLLATNDIIIDGNGNHLKWGKGMNHFAVESKHYWQNQITESGDMMDNVVKPGSDAETVIITGVLAGARSASHWKHSMEYHIACFTSEFAFSHVQKRQTWQAFDKAWNGICYDWIYADMRPNHEMNAKDKWDSITNKISNSERSRSEIPSTQYESHSTKSLFTKLKGYRWEMTQASKYSKYSENHESVKSVVFDLNEDVKTFVLETPTNSPGSDRSQDNIEIDDTIDTDSNSIEENKIDIIPRKPNRRPKRGFIRHRVSEKQKQSQKWQFLSQIPFSYDV